MQVSFAWRVISHGDALLPEKGFGHARADMCINKVALVNTQGVQWPCGMSVLPQTSMTWVVIEEKLDSDVVMILPKLKTLYRKASQHSRLKNSFISERQSYQHPLMGAMCKL